VELARDEGGGNERGGRVEVEVEGHLLMDGLHRGGGRRERSEQAAARRDVEDNYQGPRITGLSGCFDLLSLTAHLAHPDGRGADSAHADTIRGRHQRQTKQRKL
jgi:hypothetical protein